MSRTFLYCRVSTVDQVTANQVLEVQTAGFQVAAHRIVEEHISGGVAATLRPGFAKLLDRLEEGDTLIVTKVDRLGRDVIDVVGTVELLASRGVRVICMQLGASDLASPSGKMILGILAVIAAFERGLLRERVAAGLNRARAEGKALGRKPSLSNAQRAEALAQLAAGETVSATARRFNVTRQTILRIRAKNTEKPLADVEITA
jgi:putative DNA-invertase from lambdoid prophage Rac